MKIIDLVSVIAPGYPTKITGIRPGEKLHEIMITTDDVDSTIEYENCYVIRPNNVPKFQGHKYMIDEQLGKPVVEGFIYRSDLNDTWLDEAGLKNMLAQL